MLFFNLLKIKDLKIKSSKQTCFFYVLKTHVLLMDLLPSIHQIYSIVIQEENKKNLMHIKDNSILDSVAQGLWF